MKINANRAGWRIVLAAREKQPDPCPGALNLPTTPFGPAAAPPLDVPDEPCPGLARGRSEASRAGEGDRRGERHQRAVRLPDPA